MILGAEKKQGDSHSQVSNVTGLWSKLRARETITWLRERMCSPESKLETSKAAEPLDKCNRTYGSSTEAAIISTFARISGWAASAALASWTPFGSVFGFKSSVVLVWDCWDDPAKNTTLSGHTCNYVGKFRTLVQKDSDEQIALFRLVFKSKEQDFGAQKCQVHLPDRFVCMEKSLQKPLDKWIARSSSKMSKVCFL